MGRVVIVKNAIFFFFFISLGRVDLPRKRGGKGGRRGMEGGEVDVAGRGEREESVWNVSIHLEGSGGIGDEAWAR